VAVVVSNGVFCSEVLINALTGKVGTGTNLPGYPTNQDSAHRCQPAR